MNSEKNIEVEFKDQFVELKVLINDGETLGELDNFYLTRILSYPQWEALASKMKTTINHYETTKSNLPYWKNK